MGVKQADRVVLCLESSQLQCFRVITAAIREKSRSRELED
jgi:hypothetical protein